MVNIEFSEGITETIDILKHMDDLYVNKISKKFLNFLEENKSFTYKPNLDHSKKLKDMNLKEDTKNILATIYMSYWCDEDKKKDYIAILNENEKNYQKELRKKYNTDNIFKDKIQKNMESKNTNELETSMVEYKESIFKKIINKIKMIFRIK